MRSDVTDPAGVIFEIERFSVNDGPGIRTLVFLKGCALRCKWCANPESHSFTPQLVYWRSRCIGCKNCVNTCPRGALSFGENGVTIDRASCKLCWKCCDVCNSKALLPAGKRMSIDEVMAEIDKDRLFYEQSGGGVTFSGGEALMQPEFLLALMKACKDKGYHVCIETCGYAPWERIEELLPYIDLFLYDIKVMDEAAHTAYTGVSNRQILDNFQRLCAVKDVIVRFPVIPGYNDSESNLSAMLDFLSGCHADGRVDLLPYHRLGVSKYDRLGVEYQLNDILPPSAERMRELKDMFLQRGFRAEIGG